MLLRSLFSLAASCYIIASLVLLPIGLTGAHLPLPAWWAAYLAAELIVLGALVTASLWWFLWRPGAPGKRYHPSRFAGITLLVLAPIFAFLVVPIGCLVSVPGEAGTIAAAAVFAASALAFFGAWAYSRKRP